MAAVEGGPFCKREAIFRIAFFYRIESVLVLYSPQELADDKKRSDRPDFIGCLGRIAYVRSDPTYLTWVENLAHESCLR